MNMSILFLIFVIAVFAIISTFAQLEKCENLYPYELDVGIYWAKIGQKGRIDLVKSCPPTAIAGSAFTYGLPTVLIVHGAQPHIVTEGSSRMGWQEGFDDLTRLWLRAGWNVGFFQWAQFSDEPLANFERAEAKIWTSRYFKNMEYTYRDRATNETRVGEASINENVSDILIRHLLGHLGADIPYPAELRLVGHSLGSQLVTRVAHLLQQQRDDLYGVRRIALLDPVVSPFRHGYLMQEACGMTVLDDIGCYIGALTAANVSVEVYRSSFINRCIQSAEFDPELLSQSAYSHVKMNIWGEQSDGNCYSDKLWGDPKQFSKHVSALINQVYNQHTMIVPYYLLSLMSPPRLCELSSGPDGKTCEPTQSFALSAAMPTPQVLLWHDIHEIMGAKLCFHEWDDGDRSPTAPTMTLDPGDDLYYVTPCTHLSS